MSTQINQSRRLEDNFRNAFKETRVKVVPTFYDDVGPVIPVVEINPYPTKQIDVIESVSTTASGSASTITLDAGNFDIFLTNITIHLEKNATCDVATGSLNFTVVQDGRTLTLGRIPHVTLLATSRVISIPLREPLRVDQGSAITLSAPTFTAGAYARGVQVQGYKREKLL